MIKLFQEVIAAPSSSIPPSSSSDTPSSSSSSSSSSPVVDEPLAEVSECSWIKVVVPNEKPAPRRYHSGVLFERKLYVFGGVLIKPASNDFYVFDFQSKKWSLVVANGTAPSPRCGHSATVFDNKMWVFGGHDNNRNPFNDLFVFDFRTSTWEKVEIKEGELWPSPRYHHSATLLGSSFFELNFDERKKSKYFNDVFVLNIGERKWELHSSGTEFPDPRAGHITAEWNGNIYLFGGYGGDGGFDYNVDTFIFETQTKTFKEIDASGSFPRTARPLTYATHYFGEGDNKEGLVFVFGGSDGKNPLGTLYHWNLKVNKWKHIKAWMVMDDINAGGSIAQAALGKMDPIPRYGHCTVMEGGIVSVFGGSGSLFLDDIVQFDLHE